MLSDDPNGAEKLKHYDELVRYTQGLTDANNVLINTLNHTQNQLTKMFEADANYGCGFESNEEWRKAYFNLQILAQCKAHTNVYDPIDFELPMEIIE